MSHLKSVPQMLIGKLKRLLIDSCIQTAWLTGLTHTQSSVRGSEGDGDSHRLLLPFTQCNLTKKLQRFVQRKPNKTASNGSKGEKPVKERKWADVLVKSKLRQRESDGRAHTHAALGVNQAHDRIFGSELEVVNRILTWRGRGRHCYYRLSWLGLSGPHAACHKELALRKHEEPHSATLTSRRIPTSHGYSSLSLLCLSLLADFCHSLSH